jgi:hypothetical protein
MPDDQDWRLQAELHGEEARGALDHVLGRLRSPEVAKEVGEAVPHDVAVTHNGSVLFAYAASSSALESARRAIEWVLQRGGIEATISVSHWDERFDRWLQVDPPLSGEAQHAEDAAERDAETVESRTMVASTGKLIRAQVEQTMREWADKLELRCEVIEHPHLLTTQVAFTVSGPRRKLDEFAQGLRPEELATMRAEHVALLGPL